MDAETLSGLLDAVKWVAIAAAVVIFLIWWLVSRRKSGSQSPSGTAAPPQLPNADAAGPKHKPAAAENKPPGTSGQDAMPAAARDGAINADSREEAE